MSRKRRQGPQTEDVVAREMDKMFTEQFGYMAGSTNAARWGRFVQQRMSQALRRKKGTSDEPTRA